MLDIPDDRQQREMILVAELEAQRLTRQAIGPDAAPLVPPHAVAMFKELQAITKEQGPAWRARVESIFSQAPGADPAAVALIRPMVLC